MQPAQIMDQLISGTDMQMIRVAKLYLAFQIHQIIRRNPAFDCRGSSYIHKSRHLNIAMDGMKYAPPGAPLLFEQLIHIVSSCVCC